METRAKRRAEETPSIQVVVGTARRAVLVRSFYLHGNRNLVHLITYIFPAAFLTGSPVLCVLCLPPHWRQEGHLAQVSTQKGHGSG